MRPEDDDLEAMILAWYAIYAVAYATCAGFGFYMGWSFGRWLTGLF
ncbi:MAG: hypothetical protein WA904_05580 [Polaromonas sp.]